MNAPPSVTHSDGLKKFSTTVPPALPEWSDSSNCVNRKTPRRNRHASIKKCAVIVSGVRRQPNGVERPPVCHGLRWPEEIFHHGPPCFAGMERQFELRKSKDLPAKSPCVDQKMRCHRERSEASAERSRTTPRLS